MARYSAGAADLADGELRVIDAADEEVVVCRVEGRYYAVENRCSHDSNTLDGGWLEDCQIECPRHGGRFDVRSGKATRMPAVAPIATYPVEVEGDQLFVEVDD